MKHVLSLLLCLSLVVMNGLDQAAELSFSAWMPEINMVVGAVLALLVLLGLRANGPAVDVPAEPAPAPVLPPKRSRDERSRHELAALLGMLQENGRLVDFVMEDIQGQPDARVGQVARVVHQGCREVILKAFGPEPAETGVAEGEVISLPEGFAPERVRLIGTMTGEGVKGRLLHRGWVASRVELPEFTKEPDSALPGYVIAPAEIELS